MTSPTPAEQTPRTRGPRLGLGILLLGTAVLYLYDLAASGWANAFYSAAAQAGARDVTAMLFGSSDPANAITVDKTPAALWVMDVSVRMFGLNPWSVLVPQALMGVAAVGVLYAAARRVAGTAAGLVAGIVLALTPVAALMFRFNNPDALLVLLLVVAAYCTQRACEARTGRWWLIAAGVAVGFGFLAKMLQALLIVPGLVVAYLVAGRAPVRHRIRDTLAAAVAVVVSAGWYVALVEWWPVSARPYIGGSQHNSVLELALGYNGVGRLTGDEPGGLGNLNHDVGWGRLFGIGMGTEIAWLLPAAVICLTAGFVLTRRAPRTEPVRAALIIWSGWLVVTSVVFSFMNGIVHSYYTIALAPAIAAGIGTGATMLWRRRSDIRSATALSGAVLVTTVLAAVLMARHAEWLPWLRAAIAVGGVGAGVLILLAGSLGGALGRFGAGLALVSCLAAPAAYTVATVATPHSGALPSAGPGGAGGFGGGLLNAPTPSAQMVGLLAAGADEFIWAAAVIGSNNAAGYQLGADVPVMAVGGFNGTDPSPTLEEFTRYVAAGRIHYFIDAPMLMGRREHAGESAEIAAWVAQHFTATIVDTTVVYDLSRPADISQSAHSSGQ